MNDYLLTIISNIGMISMLAISAYLILITGEISFGQQAYFGISAYAGSIATTLWGWPFWVSLIFASFLSGITSGLISALTLRINGIYYSIATLAFAEMVRLSLLKFNYQLEIDDEWIGPNGSEGFGEIRWIFENNFSIFEYTILVYFILFILVAFITFIENSKLGMIFRMIGQDPLLAEIQGVKVIQYKILAATLAGVAAGLGGILYAHSFTYIDPQIFNIMLGVHALAYGIIGGLGTVFGPIIGVIIDIGFLESIRVIQGYRMIVFGGLIAIMLIFMPRGILSEKMIHQIKRYFKMNVNV